MNLDIICLETPAFYELLKEVVQHLNKTKNEYPDWIDTKTAMKVLNISSKTTLQRYRDEGLIRFTQPSKKIILYHYPSLISFLENHVYEPFKN